MSTHAPVDWNGEQLVGVHIVRRSTCTLLAFEP